MTTTIRHAKLSDAAGIANVQVSSWRTTYKGIIADEVLDKLSVTQKTRERQDRLLYPPAGSVTYVAERDGEIVGFASGGRERSENPTYTGEVYALYLLPAHQGLGIGRQLVQAVVQALLAQGLESLLILVLQDNPARGFYERLGGRVVLETSFIIGDQVLPEVGYGWPDMRTLLKDE
jgi:GNAT superfamily N-acetyltransferase